MYRKFYGTYLFYTLLWNSLFIAYATFDQEPFQWLFVVGAFLFSLGFMAILIRLPLFNRYYVQRHLLKKQILKTRYNKTEDQKMMTVFVALIAASIVGMTLYFCGFQYFKVECFVAGITAMTMSQYYDTE